MEIGEFILKLITGGALIAAVIGMVLQSAAFNGNIFLYEEKRLAIDLAEAASQAPCLSITVNGEARKGLIDAGKFASAKNDFCIEIKNRKFFVRIFDLSGDQPKEVFLYGNQFTTGAGLNAPKPIAIKYPDKIVRGELIVRVE